MVISQVVFIWRQVLYLINDLFLIRQEISRRDFSEKTNRYFQCLTSMDLTENELKLKKTISSTDSAMSCFLFSYHFPPHEVDTERNWDNFLQMRTVSIIEAKSIAIIGQKPHGSCIFIFNDTINTQFLHYPEVHCSQSTETRILELSCIMQHPITTNIKAETLWFFFLTKFHDTQIAVITVWARENFKHFQALEMSRQKLIGCIHTEGITFNLFHIDF